MAIDLDHLMELAEEITPFIEEVTGKKVPIDRIVFKEGHGVDKDDPEMARFADEATRANSMYDLRDWYYELITKKALPEIAVGAIYNILQYKVISQHMVFNGMDDKGNYIIHVAPGMKDYTDTMFQNVLAHELVHPMDEELYGFFDRRHELVSEMADIEEELIEFKHSVPTVLGYIEPLQYIEDMEAEIEEKVEEIMRLTTVIESHAMYVEHKVADKMGWDMEDIYDLSPKGIIKQVMMVPILLFPQYRKQMKIYQNGLNIVSTIYSEGLDIGMLVDDIPSEEELMFPRLYFENRDIEMKNDELMSGSYLLGGMRFEDLWKEDDELEEDPDNE